MLHAINLYQNTTLRGSTKMKPPLLLFDEPNLCNDYILRDSEYIDCFCINFPCHYVLNQVHLDTNFLDNVILTKVILRPTEKTKECRSTEIEIEENNKKKKSCQKSQEI